MRQGDRGPETLAAALELLLDRRIDGRALPSDTWIVAAVRRGFWPIPVLLNRIRFLSSRFLFSAGHVGADKALGLSGIFQMFPSGVVSQFQPESNGAVRYFLGNGALAVVGGVTKSVDRRHNRHGEQALAFCSAKRLFR